MTNWEHIIEEYIRWIKDNTIIKSVEDGKTCAVSTPFLDRHNDHVEIYVKKKDDNTFILTDDGYTIADLRMSGMEISSPKREKIFRTVLKGFGVQSQDDELYVEATLHNIGQKKHYLLHAILAVNDMFSLSQESVYSLFKEDVEAFFKANNIIHTRDVKMIGKSNLDYNIDFLVPSSKNKPERIIQAINNPKEETIKLTMFAFNDIAAVREQKMSSYVLYNDMDKGISPEVLSALTQYGINSIPWTQKQKCIEAFAIN